MGCEHRLTVKGLRAGDTSGKLPPQTFLMQKEETNYIVLSAIPTQLVHTPL